MLRGVYCSVDIIGILDRNGVEVVTYLYDTWGKLISTTGSKASTIGEDNPFRYRGYYYDEETGLYYLNQRYYNPEWGRFISADDNMGQTGELLSHNVYAYCANNPVIREDPDGDIFNVIAGVIGGVVGAVVGAATTFVGDILDDGQINTPGKEYLGAALGGATTGAIIGGTLGVGLALGAYAGAAVSSATVEVCDYASGEKNLTLENVGKSVLSVGVDTAINGTVSYATGKLISSASGFNKGWFKPSTLKSALTSKYMSHLIYHPAVMTIFAESSVKYITDNFNDEIDEYIWAY